MKGQKVMGRDVCGRGEGHTSAELRQLFQNKFGGFTLDKTKKEGP